MTRSLRIHVVEQYDAEGLLFVGTIAVATRSLAHMRTIADRIGAIITHERESDRRDFGLDFDA